MHAAVLLAHVHKYCLGVVVYNLQRKNNALEAQDLWAEALHGTGEYNAHAVSLSPQLELDANETLAKHWRRLAKKEAAAATAAAQANGAPEEAKPAHVPVTERPEATFLPSLLSEFLEVGGR